MRNSITELNRVVIAFGGDSALRGLTVVASALGALCDIYAAPNADNPRGMCDDKAAFRRLFAEMVAPAAIAEDKASGVTIDKKWGGRCQYLRIKAGPLRDVYVHTLVAEAKIGRKLTAEETVEHKDGNGLNCEPDNLIVVSRGENTLRAIARNRGMEWNDETEVSLRKAAPVIA